MLDKVEGSMKYVCRCLLLTSLLLSSFAFAANREGAMSFTLGDGYYYFASKRHLDNTNVGYGALGYDLTERYGVEGLLGFFNTQSRNTIDNGSQVNGTLFALDVIYRFTPYGNLAPYVLAGPGATSMNPNGNDAHTEGNINAGIGAQYFIDKMIAFRVDVRDFYTIVGGKNDYFINGGVSFLFD